MEDLLIAKPVFAAMKQTGRLPIAVPLQPDAKLDERLTEVDTRATADALSDERIADRAMPIVSLDAGVPDAVQAVAGRAYALDAVSDVSA